MVTDAVLVALISEALNSSDPACRTAAERLLRALNEEREPGEVDALISATDGKAGQHMRRLADRLGVVAPTGATST